MFDNIETVEDQARNWGQDHHPNASPPFHAAFINSVVYTLFRLTGRLGGPSVREHAAIAALKESGIDWKSRTIEELYVFLDPLVYGPIQDVHIRTWSLMKDICFDNDPADIHELNEATEHVTLKMDGRYETTRIWPQTLRKLRLIAAMCSESVVESIDRLANEELARLRYQRKEENNGN